MPRMQIIVSGLVQGVGFRYFVHSEAVAFMIRGWVKNKPDGTVEIDAEGSRKNLDGFIAALRAGNGYSEVETIRMEEIAETGVHKTFGIRF